MGKPKRKLTPYNKCMSRELKGNMSGKTKAQRAALFKAAAKRCSKNPARKASTSSEPKSRASAPKSNPTGGTRRMTKNSFNMNKIYGAIRKISIFIPAADLAMRTNMSTEHKIKHGILWYFGWSPYTHRFVWSELWKGWGPHIGAQVVTRVVPAINKLIRSFF